MPYFFAYGARMNPGTMQSDTPGAVMVGPARLEGYRLAFNVQSRSWGGGAANAVPSIDGHLWGVLWEVGEAELDALNSFRGDEQMQKVFVVEVEGPDGPVKATTFSVDSPERFVAPSDRYLAMLRAVVQQQGLPEEALSEIDTAATGGPSGPAPSI